MSIFVCIALQFQVFRISKKAKKRKRRRRKKKKRRKKWEPLLAASKDDFAKFKNERKISKFVTATTKQKASLSCLSRGIGFPLILANRRKQANQNSA